MQEISFIFETLDVYKKTRKLVSDIYLLMESFPSTERHVLCDQIRRAAISIPSNIAEGYGRFSIKERVHFVEIAYGSLMEVYCQLSIANDLRFITSEKYEAMKINIDEIAKMLYGLRRSLLRSIEDNSKKATKS